MTQDTHQKETLLLKQPTVSESQVAFLYAGELWIAARDGSQPRRLTAHAGRKVVPMFSPNGEWIAFSANYDGNTSVYVISKEGGSPRRLTQHPSEDWVRGWTPDGKQILFASSRASDSSRNRRLFTVPLEGGYPTVLPLAMAERGAYSADGSRLAYTAYGEAFWSWKRYRGGQTVPIWVLDLASYEMVEIPHVNASDTFPCWLGGAVYFLSDRSQTMNVFRWEPGAQVVEQVTFHEDYDVRSLTAGGGVLAYEQGGRIFLYDPIAVSAAPLSISVAADLPYTRPHFSKASYAIQNCGISPSGLRALFEARGDIFSVPAKKGDTRNLTRTPGSCERYPAWSPDGQSIAYLSDARGEYELVIGDQKGSKPIQIDLGKRSFFYSPLWSPDSQKIAFTDKGLNLSYIELESKKLVTVDTDTYDHPERSLNPAWSPDSAWIAYTKRLDNHIRAVFLYELATGQKTQVTDGLGDTTDACFSRDGKYLFFTASSNYGLNTGWLDMTSYERPVQRSLYVVVLNKEDPSPFAPESDEEKKAEEATGGKDVPKPEGAAADQPAGSGSDQPSDAKSGGDVPPKPAPVKVKVDLDGLSQRILAFPIPARGFANLQSVENRLFFLETLPHQGLENDNFAYQLNVYDFKERKAELFIDKLHGYWVSADGKKLLYHFRDKHKYAIVGTEKRPDAGEGALDLDGMDIYVDPKAEWKQIFREAYRIHRDYFYDATLHGLDLEAAYQKYLPFLDHVGHRDDLNYLLSEFSGELVVGHAFIGGGDIPDGPRVSIGLLGADYEVTPEGYYRFKRIYKGQNWHPELRAPLTEPGVNVQEGDYLLAVNGQALRAPVDVYSLFGKTADRITDLLVSPTTNPDEGRTVSVKPVYNETSLRHWAWVEANRQKVDQLSNGKVAYIYMPDTGSGGYEAFNRYYFAQLDKAAVVLDERFNGGGSAADYVIDLLNRPILSYWATREGKEFATPNASIFGPKVMIINELAGSGGDAMPLYFRRRGLGKLVGKRTWGGLVGIYDYPAFIDGGFFTSPRMAIFNPDGQWEVENEGVAPDIEVEMTPKLVLEGRDPQLEKAVEVVMAELEASPFQRPSRPAPARRASSK